MRSKNQQGGQTLEQFTLEICDAFLSKVIFGYTCTSSNNLNVPLYLNTIKIATTCIITASVSVLSI